MPNRLSKIYTRTGDQGETGLANGSRVLKHSNRIDALGTVDELNSWLGIILATPESYEILYPVLAPIQHQLFDLGGELAVADESYKVIDQSDIDQLEHWIDKLNASLPPLKEFILPGGSISMSNIHLARTVCRRAERVIIALNSEDSETVNPYAISFLNRLSDLLFVTVRFLAKEQNEKEILWTPKAKRTNTET